ncbi:hypothetical protein Tsubulata_042840 [Turnera subulata]|uniref:CCHC-type domain-containing protein n=1 Tax=Turnera subulata TaxID=218843 RepID=A0A9Q0JGD6_9ROSI|nr:hypothetical protein Tsubulata_042840 [Turnera subulata]
MNLGKPNSTVDNPTAEESTPLVFEEEEVDTEPSRAALCLVGSLWTARPFNAQALMRTQKQVWRPTHDVEIHQLDRNLFIFQFFHWQDKERVLEQEPWNFDNQILLLKNLEGDEQSSAINLTHVPLWVRAYDIPLHLRKPKFIELLGSKAGQFTQLDTDRDLQMSKFARMRISKDVRTPLIRGFIVTLKNGSLGWVYFKYERLPWFYFHCGCIGHLLRDCTKIDPDDLQNPALVPYTDEIRASPLRKPRGEPNPIPNTNTACRKLVFRPPGSSISKTSYGIPGNVDTQSNIHTH